MSRQIYIWLLFLVLPVLCRATHIVGGVLNYTYNGGNIYTIKLKLYRDCGSSSAAFPGSVTIVIRGNNGVAFSPGKDLTMSLGTTTTISANLAPCAVAPNPLPCVQEGVYTKTISLPPNAGGYHLYYQVEARNLSTSNVNAVCNCIGESFYAYIPNNTVAGNSNSNAVFNLFPPLFICINKPFTFNHAATDADGDSLAYSLYTPYNGESGTGPLDPTFAGNVAAFTPVSFIAGFTTNNPLGASPFTINPVTGLLSCTPGILGQFVVGVKVKEYRNGVSISETLRDFQFNVLNCPVPPPTLAISNMTINNGCSLKIIATGITTASATWSSVYPGTPGLYNSYLSCTSACLSPTISSVGSATTPPYADYAVCGIATNCLANNICDTFRVYFNPPLSASVMPTVPALCNGQTATTVTAVGSGGSPPYSYLWNNVNTSQVINVGVGTYNIKITDASGCPPAYNSVSVISYSTPVLANAGADQVRCIQSPVAALSGSVSGATGGMWSGGTGTFSPNNTSLSGIFYTPSATELASGSVTLTLTTTGNGSCPPAQDAVVLSYSNFTGLASATSTAVSCYGGNNGKAGITITGGTGPYTWLWSTFPAQTTATAGTLAYGTYSVSITNGIGCTLQQTVSVTQPLPLNISATVIPVSCNAGSNGSISVTPSGGTAPYTYSWSSGSQTTAAVSGLSAGTYSLSFGDAHGCTAASVFTITQPAAIAAVLSKTNVSCYQGSNGAISSSVSGGSTPYTYTWLPSGSTSPNSSGLAAGNYSLLINDNMGCPVTITTSVSEPPALVVNTTITNEICSYSNNGSVTTLVSGGTPGYTYAWPTLTLTSANASNLSSGTYTLVVTDSKSCSVSKLISITEPLPLTVTIANISAVKCFGANNASATAIASGGTSAYTYSWSPAGGTAAQASNLAAGIYSVLVMDNHFCTTSSTVAITQPLLPLSLTGTSSPVSCFGGSNGSASVSCLGGTTPYTFAWLPNGQTGSVMTGLSQGNYSCTVTDAKGCTLTGTYAIAQASSLTIALTQTNISCFNGSNGALTSTITGGHAPYTFLWLPGNYTTQAVSGLSAGSLTLNITDNLNCPFSATAALSQAPVLSVITTTVAESCDYKNDGSASAAGYGGTPPYAYSWAPGALTTASISNLSSGAYNHTLTDAAGCSIATLVVIPQPAALSITFTNQLNPSCYGGNNGAVSALAGGGTANYTYAWSGGAGNAATALNLSAGIYALSVTDSHSCVVQNTIALSEPAILSLVTSITNVNCNGGSNGAIVISPGGGTAPYIHNLLPGNSSGTNFSNLAPGNYSIITNDANNCTLNTAITISQPISLTSVVSTSNSACLQQDGLASILVTSGGVPPFTYTWLPSGGTASVSGNLYAGTYTVEVTGNDGCATSKIININDTGGPLVSIVSTTDIACNGGANGAVEAAYTGGTGPAYTYSWNPAGGNSLTASNLISGIYTMKVTDANGCIGLATSPLLTQPFALSVNFNTSPVSCFGGTNGSATAGITGGTPGYTLGWQPGAQSGTIASALGAGIYSLTVTDGHNCAYAATVSVTEPAAAMSLSMASQNTSCFNGSDGSVSALAAGGTSPYSYTLFPGNSSGQNYNNLSAGTYTVGVSDMNGCPASESITVGQPAALSFTTTTSNSNCSLANGGATLVPAGGTGPYSCQWFPAGGTVLVTNTLYAGGYTITVSDAHLCSAVASETISDNPAPILSVTINSMVSCFGGNNAVATALAGSGTGPYIYSWLPGNGASSTLNNLSAGTYTVLVTAANNCTAAAVSQVITQPPALFSSMAALPVNCFGGSTGSATVFAGGGTPGYTVLWLHNSAAGASLNGLAAGSYTTQVTDSHSCTVNATVSVTQPLAPLSLSINSFTAVSCFGGNNGSALGLASGGTPFYTYSWTPGAFQSASATGLTAGTYSLRVYDNNGCSAASNVTITAPALPLTATYTTTPVKCFAAANGSATLSPVGGTAGYNYQWSPALPNSATVQGLAPGNYFVTVSDVKGCQTYCTFLMDQPSLLTASLSSIPPACGNADGSISSQVNGGTAPYAYLWTPGAVTTPTLGGLNTGTYSLAVSDTRSCTVSLSTTLITIPGPLITALSTKSVSCFGGNNGASTLNISQGTLPYLVTWLPYGGNALSAGQLSSGSFTAFATDARGCVAQLPLVIHEPAELNLSLAAFVNVSCFNAGNGSATLSASGGVLPYVYAWLPSGSGSAPSGLSAGTYSVTVKDHNNCSKKIPVLIDQPLPLSASITNIAPALCYNGTGGATVSVLGGTAPYTYTWNATPAQHSNELFYVRSGIYSVSIKDLHGCSVSNTVLITQPTQVTTQVTKADTICIGTAAGLLANASGGLGNYYYSWAPGGVITTGTFAPSPSAGASYTVLAFDQNGCSGADAETKVIVYDLAPQNLKAFGSGIICPGKNTAIYAKTTGITGPLNLNWNPALGNGTGTYNVSPPQTTTYYIEVTNTCGKTLHDSVLVQVSPPPVVAFTADTLYACAPGIIQFTNKSTAPGHIDPIIGWDWNFGDGNYSGGENPSNLFETAGTYSVQLMVTTDRGCTGKSTGAFFIEIMPRPIASFTVDAASYNLPYEKVTCVNSSTGAARYSWTFGDGGTSDADNPIYLPQQVGDLNIMLVTTSQFGCTDTASLKITTSADVVFPSAFTPNIELRSGGSYNVSDLSNDVFFPYTSGVVDFEIQVFNRWGELVFESRDIRTGWDGYYKEKICPQDVYYWKARVLLNNGKEYKRTGDVTLLR